MSYDILDFFYKKNLTTSNQSNISSSYSVWNIDHPFIKMKKVVVIHINDLPRSNYFLIDDISY